ncbi:MAG: glycosyltransferase [Alphaproteobacteria bacterium]|nr:glycosyltransferase [Alphaproteobacteria bacterium SS10]
MHITFAASMCALDPVSGAMHSVRAILETLQANGCTATSYTASVFDAKRDVSFAQAFGPEAGSDAAAGKIVSIQRNGVNHYIYRTQRSRGRYFTDAEQQAMIERWRDFLATNKPDLILSFSRSNLAKSMRKMAADAGAKVVLYLGNAEVDDEAMFAPGYSAICPSAFLAEHYRKTYGLETAVINPIIAPEHQRESHLAKLDVGSRQALGFVTLINPMPHKGLALFAKLAARAAAERPDVRFLVIEGRMPRSTLQARGLDLGAWPNVWLIPEQQDMGAVYARTAMLLMPSYWAEGFGRTVVEAHLSGVPVLASDRGGLPEALGGVPPLPAPPSCLEDFNRFPTPDELEPWWDRMVSLWDDAQAYDQAVTQAHQAAEQFYPDATKQRLLDWFAKQQGTPS